MNDVTAQFRWGEAAKEPIAKMGGCEAQPNLFTLEPTPDEARQASLHCCEPLLARLFDNSCQE
jgi:hypothetical protein